MIIKLSSVIIIVVFALFQNTAHASGNAAHCGPSFEAVNSAVNRLAANDQNGFLSYLSGQALAKYTDTPDFQQLRQGVLAYPQYVVAKNTLITLHLFFGAR